MSKFFEDALEKWAKTETPCNIMHSWDIPKVVEHMARMIRKPEPSTFYILRSSRYERNVTYVGCCLRLEDRLSQHEKKTKHSRKMKSIGTTKHPHDSTAEDAGQKWKVAFTMKIPQARNWKKKTLKFFVSMGRGPNSRVCRALNWALSLGLPWKVDKSFLLGPEAGKNILLLRSCANQFDIGHIDGYVMGGVTKEERGIIWNSIFSPPVLPKPICSHHQVPLERKKKMKGATQM